MDLDMDLGVGVGVGMGVGMGGLGLGLGARDHGGNGGMRARDAELRRVAQRPGRNAHAHAHGHGGHGVDAVAPQVERLASMMSGGRYVAFSIAATAIAVASAYQTLYIDRIAPPGAAMNDRAQEANGGEEQEGRKGQAMTAAAQTSDDITVQMFLDEIMRTRLSAMIVLHFYFVLVYHVFLAATRLCFGAIRPPEIQQTKETILHFLLMRSLLLASTLGATKMKPPIALLLVWLSALAFVRGLLSICSARFEYLLTRPMTAAREFHRLAATLVIIMALNVAIAVICAVFGSHLLTTTIVHLAWFEASLFLIRAAQLATKVVFHVFDVGNVSDHSAEKDEHYLLLLQTALSAAYLLQLIVYYLYIISVDHFRVSFLDFILILNVKNATVQVLEKVSQVQTYQRVVVELDARFPDATLDELEAVRDDVCVICLKPMETHAKRLTCGHLFHRFCLRQCLQRASVGDAFTATMGPMGGAGNGDPLPADGGGEGGGGQARTAPSLMINSFRCPICRKPVRSDKDKQHTNNSTSNEDATMARSANQDRYVPHDLTTRRDRDMNGNGNPDQPERGGDQNQTHDDTTTHDHPSENGDAQENEPEQAPVVAAVAPPVAQESVFRISTEFLARWLPVPNVSFEIVRPAIATPFVVTEDMLLRVWEVFPQYPAEVLRRDLLRTRSPERTIERILLGRLAHHAPMDVGLGDGPGPDVDELGHELRTSLSALWNAMWNPEEVAAPPAVRAEGLDAGNNNMAQ